MSKYSMVMSWPEEDEAYIVSVPELPGCMADGKTPTEAVENAEKLYRNGLKRRWKTGKKYQNLIYLVVK